MSPNSLYLTEFGEVTGGTMGLCGHSPGIRLGKVQQCTSQNGVPLRRRWGSLPSTHSVAPPLNLEASVARPRADRALANEFQLVQTRSP